jgi:hypothetical protein
MLNIVFNIDVLDILWYVLEKYLIIKFYFIKNMIDVFEIWLNDTNMSMIYDMAE